MIVVRRLSGRRVNARAKYSVWIDGARIARLRQGDQGRYKVPAGHHQLKVSIDWAGSPTLDVHLQAGEVASFACEPHSNLGHTALLTSLVRPRRYIDLYPAPFPEDATT